VVSDSASPPDAGLASLFESSPDPDVHTSAAAETSFLFALAALLAAPFSLTHGATIVLGASGAVLALVGMVTTNRVTTAGRALVPFGLFLSLIALVVVALRYLGVDTAFGDDLTPVLEGWLERLNGVFRR
jgi:hypothetical protein